MGREFDKKEREILWIEFDEACCGGIEGKEGKLVCKSKSRSSFKPLGSRKQSVRTWGGVGGFVGREKERT